MDPRDYILDIPGLADREAQQPSSTPPPTSGGRPWIAVYYKCCRTYARLYRNREADAYVGHCPKCGAHTRASIGPGGTDQRFFTAG